MTFQVVHPGNAVQIYIGTVAHHRLARRCCPPIRFYNFPCLDPPIATASKGTEDMPPILERISKPIVRFVLVAQYRRSKMIEKKKKCLAMRCSRPPLATPFGKRYLDRLASLFSAVFRPEKRWERNLIRARIIYKRDVRATKRFQEFVSFSQPKLSPDLIVSEPDCTAVTRASSAFALHR